MWTPISIHINNLDYSMSMALLSISSDITYNPYPSLVVHQGVKFPILETLVKHAYHYQIGRQRSTLKLVSDLAFRKMLNNSQTEHIDREFDSFHLSGRERDMLLALGRLLKYCVEGKRHCLMR
jgi:hypothetical protein